MIIYNKGVIIDISLGSVSGESLCIWIYYGRNAVCCSESFRVSVQKLAFYTFIAIPILYNNHEDQNNNVLIN